MRKHRRGIVMAGISTHSRNDEGITLFEPDTKLTNHGNGLDLFTPEKGDTKDNGSISTHSKILAGNNVSDLDNDVDPASGYLPERTEDGLVLDEGEDVDTTLINASDDGDDLDWDEEADAVLIDDLDEQGIVDEDTDVTDASVEVIEDDNAYDLIDVDGTDDTDVLGMLFATVNKRLLVLKANRIIAELKASDAEEQGIEDVYLGDEFEEATVASVSKVGLRAGLKSMGFKLTRVNIGASAVLNSRVKALAERSTKAILAKNVNRDQILAQSLAIASVGINRKFFKGTENVLANALINSLTNAGVQRADRIVHAAFAKHGVAYTHAILDQAKVLANLDDASRNKMAEAVDLIDDTGEFAQESTYVVKDDSDVDVIDANTDEFSDFEDSIPEAITAALARPGKPSQNEVLANLHKGVPLSASAILASSEVLQF